MTRWLMNRPIPKKVVAPTNEALEAESRAVDVTGVGTYPKCPNCGRTGPVDALMLGDGSTWPNVVVVCGSPNCEVWWGLVPRPPLDYRPVG